jgi:hypothetical protein
MVRSSLIQGMARPIQGMVRSIQVMARSMKAIRAQIPDARGRNGSRSDPDPNVVGSNSTASRAIAVNVWQRTGNV